IKGRIPGETQIRCRLFEIAAIGIRSEVDLWVEVRAELAGLEKTSGGSKEIGNRGSGPETIGVVHRSRKLPAETIVQRQMRFHPPLVLEIDSAYGLLLPIGCFAKDLILVGRGIHPTRTGNIVDAANQAGIKRFCVWQILTGIDVREIGLGEHTE